MSDNDDYWGDVLEREQKEDAEEAQRRKEEVGEAAYGSPQWKANAWYVLKSYRHPSKETEQKLRDLDGLGGFVKRGS
jgi:hypothetical protein